VHTLNPNLFRHREVSSAGLNNLCTIIHRVRDEGLFTGRVVQGATLLGTFELRCAKESAATQTTIDLSRFDSVLNAKSDAARIDPLKYEIGRGGFAIFHASGHHNDLYVTLSRARDEKASPVFDSRRLSADDVVAIRPLVPGKYALSAEAVRSNLSVLIKQAEGGKFPALTKFAPTVVRLTEKGFDPPRIENWPVQAIVVQLGVPSALKLTMVGEKPDKPGRKTAKPRK
jgi:hypothetical protein